MTKIQIPNRQTSNGGIGGTRIANVDRFPPTSVKLPFRLPCVTHKNQIE